MTLTALAHELAERPARDLDSWRPVFAFLTEWPEASRAQQQETLAAAPSSTREPKWDACIAALAEYLALRDGLEPPRWARQAQYALDTFWFPVSSPGAVGDALVYAPASFACRGIFIERRDLERV
ncbi:MAG: hypothetical protein ACREOD_00725 [Candidatus Dormibacteria bacterium]